MKYLIKLTFGLKKIVTVVHGAETTGYPCGNINGTRLKLFVMKRTIAE